MNKLNKPKNISEYVAEYVIKHNCYRDNEIKNLEDILNKFEIVKCRNCKKYHQYLLDNEDQCEICDNHNDNYNDSLCDNCLDVQHYDTWNLSGMDMCKTCSLSHCHYCILEMNTDESTIGKCEFCDTILCKRCKTFLRCCSGKNKEGLDDLSNEDDE